MKLNLQELAALRVAKKRNTDENLSENLKKQYSAGDYTTIKVTLKYSEVNSYQELWQVVGEEKYYSRYVCGIPVWYSVCDPLGYAELNDVMPDNVIFIVCDSNGEELFGSSNIDGAVFPTLEETCIKEWYRIKGDYPHCKDDCSSDFWMQYFGNGTTIGADMWLLTFKDPEIYGEVAKDYDENWIYHKEKIDEKPISEFTYLGQRYGIWKITYRHRDCKKIMYEYWVALFKEGCNLKIAEYGLVKFLDSWFEGEPGTMYLKRDAIKKVTDALEEIYEKKPISKIISAACDYFYERFMSYKSAARELLNGNWNREFVERVIENEKKNNSFWITRDPAIEKTYPGYVKDYHYNYDFCGRRI